MARPFKLKISDIFLKADAAMKAGQLQAPGRCRYRSDTGAPCVIGAAMTDAQAKRMDNVDTLGGATVAMLVEERNLLTIIEDVPGLSFSDVVRLQRAFDQDLNVPSKWQDVLASGVATVRAHFTKENV